MRSCKKIWSGSNEENMHFYRFTEGKFGYPTMIELFSRKPGYHLEIKEGIIPIHIDDDTSSLSAILLNDDFYEFMMSGRKVADVFCLFLYNVCVGRCLEY